MEESTLELTSPAFDAGGEIPRIYTCEGEQISPPLTIMGKPVNAQSFALVVEDPDVPKEVKADGIFVHWVLFNIPADTSIIAEGTSAGVIGANGMGEPAYTGPCPPKEYEPRRHRYFFHLYALGTMLDLPQGASEADLMRAMEGHVLAHTQLMATYQKTQ